jgi:hypothetical protein
MMGKMQGKRKVGRQEMIWIENVEPSMQMNLVEVIKATRTETHGEPGSGRSSGVKGDLTELRRR